MTMAYSSSSLSSFPYTKPHTPPPTSTKKGLLPATAGGRGGRDGGNLRFSIKAVKSPESADPPATTTETETETPAAAPKPPKKPVYSRLDYIYEDRGEVLDIRIFETGEYALIAWIGVPTAPAWLPTDMLIKSDKLDYERI
ncbi:NAD(P)H-quinone oxidoreductase subunit O [Cynara cardunculus var. scolymus]|uniref:NAD(P)H-quinone oxidoreductase subunit O n=1 Tax=Cynara cardunculus var. scolymus TaxID=59895 RepID=A0A124SGZ8_CYNCS|nr:NAD(P)H-quinone oxidoreductase subunit O [Cynara cardunculus var. scolymus]